MADDTKLIDMDEVKAARIGRVVRMQLEPALQAVVAELGNTLPVQYAILLNVSSALLDAGMPEHFFSTQVATALRA